MRRTLRLAVISLGLLAISNVPAIGADAIAASFPGRFWRSRDCCEDCESAVAPDKSPMKTPDDTRPMPQPMPMPGDVGTADADAQLFGALAGTGEAGVGAGANTAFLGRADALNRFNLFDNMSAEPTTRTWFAYQFVEGLNSNVVGNSLIGRPNQSLYRIGMEYAISDVSSFAAQGMYNVTSDTADGTAGAIFDNWSNPQFIFKRVLVRNECSTVSGTLGFEAQVGTEISTINERFSRIQPGLLAYRELANDQFAQAGMQFNVPLRGNATSTFDWAVAYGRWLVRDESLTGCGSGCNDGCCRPFVLGVTLQAELLGKHVVQDATIANGFAVDTPIQSSPGFPPTFSRQTFDFEEERQVVDFTFGSQILFCNHSGVGLAFSTPISGGEVRRNEFMMTYNYYY